MGSETFDLLTWGLPAGLHPKDADTEGTVMVTKEYLREVDRNARAYGFEIGRGRPLDMAVEASPENPFMDPSWRMNAAEGGN